MTQARQVVIFLKEVQRDKTPLAEGDITVLLSVYSGMSALILLMAVLYYPSKPPSPPSHTAAGNIYLSTEVLNNS